MPPVLKLNGRAINGWHPLVGIPGMSFIFVAGMMGSGKSTIGEKFSEMTFTISSDDVQRKAVERAFPYLTGNKYAWDAWPKNKKTIRICDLVSECISEDFERIRSMKGGLIIEGSILVQEWFRQSLVKAIQNSCDNTKEWSSHCYLLSLTAEEIYARIKKRAREVNGRAKELERFKDLESVRKHKHGYNLSIEDPVIWMERHSSKEIETEVLGLLGAIGV